MASLANVTKHMRVMASDSVDVGAVDDVSADHIKLTRAGSPDGQHHRIPVAWVDRVDTQVHLNRPAADVTGMTSGDVAGARAAATPAVKKRSPLLWLGLAGLALLLLLLMMRSCGPNDREIVDEAAAPVTAPVAPPPTALTVETITLPGGQAVELAPASMNYALQRYLASNEAAPRTFTFDKLNFATSSAQIPAEDQATLSALAQILTAYPNARAQLVGYADAQGSDSTNMSLGAARAVAVKAALVAQGVNASRLDTKTGGENDPVAANTSAGGRAENRRTELVVLSR